MADNIPSMPGGAVPPQPPEGSKVQPKKDTLRINLPPKPSAAPTIKLPTLPPGQSAFDAVKLTKKPDIAALAQVASGDTRAPNRNVELDMILAAVLLFNGTL